MSLFREILPTDSRAYPRAFDLLLIDEVHTVAPAGRGQYALPSQRTQAIRELAPHFEHHLYLSATPHNGYFESWTALLEMLDPQRFARDIAPSPEAVRQIMVRRLKSELREDPDLRRPDGSPRFAKREIVALEVDYPAHEREAHRLLDEYTASRRKATGGDRTGRRAAEFVTLLLKKRLFSSPIAFAKTLETHRQTLAEAASKQMHEVLQVSGKHGTIASVRLAKTLIELVPKSLNKVFFSTGGSEANEFALKAARELTRRERPDCVITTSPPQSAHLLGLRLARQGIPWIAEFRDGWRFERPRGDWPFRAQRALDGRLERAVVRRADAVVAVTRPIAEDLERRFGRPVALITNGFDPDDVDGVGAGTDSLLDVGRFSIVHTGSMGFTGGTTRPLVEALRLLRDETPDVASRLEVVFAGLLSTDEAALLESSDLAGIVRCVGSLERASVLQLQRSADVLLVVTEGARRRSVATGKLFEYLTTNRPILVLGPETEAARIVLETKRGLATAADDPRSIAETLGQLVEGDDLSQPDKADVSPSVLY